jgi:LPXTG-site transpeptidase (sortase) family protein
VFLPCLGTFVDLVRLVWGDEILLHTEDGTYVYQVRRRQYTYPGDETVLTHEDYDWLTLITCKGFDVERDAYTYRVVVKAVLVEVR